MNYKYLMDLADWMERVAVLDENDMTVELRDKARDLRADALVAVSQAGATSSDRKSDQTEAS